MQDKAQLMQKGDELARVFCLVNSLDFPGITVCTGKWPFNACAYYRPSEGIVVNVSLCASIGVAGASWSFPGYVVDRTPYGVVQHELGHFVDVLMSDSKGKYYGNYSVNMRARASEPPITSYCPDDYEWFAEMFRLFVTNPDMLRRIRPRTYGAIRESFFPVFYDSFDSRLSYAPPRTLKAARKKVGIT